MMNVAWSPYFKTSTPTKKRLKRGWWGGLKCALGGEELVNEINHITLSSALLQNQKMTCQINLIIVNTFHWSTVFCFNSDWNKKKSTAQDLFLKDLYWQVFTEISVSFDEIIFSLISSAKTFDSIYLIFRNLLHPPWIFSSWCLKRKIQLSLFLAIWNITHVCQTFFCINFNGDDIQVRKSNKLTIFAFHLPYRGKISKHLKYDLWTIKLRTAILYSCIWWSKSEW